MRKLYLFLALVFMTGVYGQEPFITTWEIPEFLAKSITVPVVSGPGVNYTIDFGDGVVLTNQTGPCVHTYAAAGEYTVTISGSFNRIHFGSLPSSLGDQTGQIETIKLKSIVQWGDTQWSTMEGAFENCNALGYISTTDMPDLSQVTSIKRMFFLCLQFNPGMFSNMNDWDVSNVTNMEETFAACHYFNTELNNWDVSNVTTMRGMFMEAVDFNKALNDWDVSNVTDMSNMFRGAGDFNKPLNSWDVSSVTNMSSMFDGSGLIFEYRFNQSLSNWDVSNVTDMSYMFSHTDLFNQSLNDWDVSNVTNMSGMFSYSKVFNQPLSTWNVSNVTDMSEMFMSSVAFNGPLNGWDVSNVTSMSKMFRNAKAFNQPLNDWETSSLTNVEDMFYSALVFNQSLDNWNMGGVTSLENMFYKAPLFNGSINSWDVSNVTSLKYTFREAAAFNQPLNDWNVSGVQHAEYMFRDAVSFNQDLSNWELSYAWVSGMFQNASNFDQDLSDWNFDNIYLIGSNETTFISNSGLSTENYDALLLRFAQQEIDGGIDSFSVSGLQYCNVGVRQYLIDELEWYFSGDSLSETCQGNTISGTVRFDENADGCDTADITVPNFLIRANDETYNYASSTNPTGEYNMLVMENTYATSLLNVPDYFTVSPQQQTVSFTGFGNEEEVNFCLTANQQVNDLNITLLPINEARPGFPSQYQLIVQNIGTQTVANAVVTLSYNEAIQSFTGAAPAATSSSAGALIFNLTDLQPFESRTTAITMQTFTPPTVNGGEVINFTASVTPDNSDVTPIDNTFAYVQTVVNSFDPNDKQVLQGEEIFIEQAEGYLDYLIRFQNTGTASAITVRIEDHLPENVDWTTLRPVSSSHEYSIKLKDEHTVEFIFDNINLPHEDANEPGSHGFIAYKIKPLPTVAVGDVITGNAEIFFDYNLPIVTNFATTEVVEEMGIGENVMNSVSLYPNPVSEMLHVSAPNGIAIEEVKIYNLQGRELIAAARTETINVEKLSSGVYIVMIKTDAGSLKSKLVKN